jgi:hypothetical protein
LTLFAPDLLAEMQNLSQATLAVIAGVGLLLWLTGWYLHRFWLTVLTSFGVGLLGLKIGPQYGVEQPVIAGVLLALAGGCLALALARLALFIVYGLAVWQLALQFAPAYAVPLVCITAGGLVSILLFRLCLILLTSAAGTILLGYAGLALAGQGGLDLKGLAADYGTALCIGAGMVWLFGVFLQQRIARAMRRAELRRQEHERLRRRAPDAYAANAAGLLTVTRKAG